MWYVGREGGKKGTAGEITRFEHGLTRQRSRGATGKFIRNDLFTIGTEPFGIQLDNIKQCTFMAN